METATVVFDLGCDELMAQLYRDNPGCRFAVNLAGSVVGVWVDSFGGVVPLDPRYWMFHPDVKWWKEKNEK